MTLLSTDYEIGIYSKGIVITEYLWQIPTLFSSVVIACSAVSKEDRLFSLKVAQLLRLSLLAIGVLTILLLILSKFVVLTMFGEPYTGSIAVLRIFRPGVILYHFYIRYFGIWIWQARACLDFY